MFAFACLHHFLFPARDYVVERATSGAAAPMSIWQATVDALPGVDLFRDLCAVCACARVRGCCGKCSIVVRSSVG